MNELCADCGNKEIGGICDFCDPPFTNYWTSKEEALKTNTEKLVDALNYVQDLEEECENLTEKLRILVEELRDEMPF